MTTMSPFPAEFLWGAATAAYQIEGAARAGGKGPSIWDDFSHQSGAVWKGHTGDVACDHVARMPQDVALMQQMGLQAYRFSVSWPRVLPLGTGAVNEAGLGFYDRLVDELLARQIVPFCTLYHWDLPSALQARGGWQTREIADWFGEYAEVLARRLGDRVKHWITLNEPQIFITLGLQAGLHAPGLKLPVKDVLQAAHHAMLAHGRAVQALRAHCPGAQIGFAPQTPMCFPSTDSPADVAAARQLTFSTGPLGAMIAHALKLPAQNVLNGAWWLDPIFHGHYPEDGLAFYGADAPQVEPGDMAVIHQPLDFFGMNVYFGLEISTASGTPAVVPAVPGAPLTGIDWPLTPRVLNWGPRFMYERYGKPIYITENGMAAKDWVSLDGEVHDPQRIDYMILHLRELAAASASGVDVRGYFHWSLMDNFEWAEGYKHRFGLVHVDYASGTRTPKQSAAWYRRLIEHRGAGLFD